MSAGVISVLLMSIGLMGGCGNTLENFVTLTYRANPGHVVSGSGRGVQGLTHETACAAPWLVCLSPERWVFPEIVPSC